MLHKASEFFEMRRIKKSLRIADLSNGRNTEILSLTQLSYLILPNGIVILLVFIEFHKLLHMYLCDFRTSLVNDYSVSQ